MDTDPDSTSTSAGVISTSTSLGQTSGCEMYHTMLRNSCGSSEGDNLQRTAEISSTSELASEGSNGTDDSEMAATLQVDLKSNERIIRCFYNALAMGNIILVNSLLPKDLDLWFHGPRCHQYMSKLLTGMTSYQSVLLYPTIILATRNIVIVEGEGFCQEVSWVHIWTVKEGRLVQLREYWDIGVSVNAITSLASECGTLHSPSMSQSTVIWQSKIWQAVNKTRPGLILNV